MKTIATQQPKSHYKFLIFLAIFYFTGWAASYPLVYKIVSFHRIVESSAIFLFPFCYALSDVITEVYGYRIARQVVWAGIICGFIFCAALEIISRVPGAIFWHHNSSYEIVLGNVLRVYIAMTVASFVGNFLNIYIISKFKIIMHGKNFWLRSLFSTGIGELIFTLVGGTMVYAGVQPWSKIIFLMLDGYLFKMLYALIAVWPTVLIVMLLKKAEKTDAYDYNVNYNPFIFD